MRISDWSSDVCSSDLRILEVYANVAEFDDGIYGAQAAARSYWRKDAVRLTPAQSATPAAVLPNPKQYSAARPGPYVQRLPRWTARNVRGGKRLGLGKRVPVRLAMGGVGIIIKTKKTNIYT